MPIIIILLPVTRYACLQLYELTMEISSGGHVAFPTILCCRTYFLKTAIETM